MSGPTRRITVGLLADPDEPTDLAQEIARELPDLLTKRVDSQVEWDVEVTSAPFTVGRETDQEILEAARQYVERERWDVAICLTDVPIPRGVRSLVADVSASRRLALISLPALGGVFLGRRARSATVQLVAELIQRDVEPDDLLDEIVPESTAPVRRTEPREQGVDVRFVATPLRGRVRLLLGMVRANRPWRLVPHLSTAFAAALATSAIVTFNSTVWELSAALGPFRLAVGTVLSIVIMVLWLIIDHGLWERPSDNSLPRRQKAALYNASTLLTFTIGVLCCYVALLALNLTSSLAVVHSGVFQEHIGRHADLGTYMTLAWMISSIATVGGALGSGLESDEAVRAAAYSERERARRAEAAHVDRTAR